MWRERGLMILPRWAPRACGTGTIVHVDNGHIIVGAPRAREGTMTSELWSYLHGYWRQVALFLETTSGLLK